MATEAERGKVLIGLLVQEPISPTSMFVGHPFSLTGISRKFRDRPGQVRRVRTVNVRLQGRQVDFDDLVKVFFRSVVAFLHHQ
jgi:hypothetical protein